MKQLEQFFTIEYLQDFDPAERIKREIIDEETGEVIDVWYQIEGINAGSKYVEPNIAEFKALLKANSVIDPIFWIVKIHPVIGINYEKYLYVKALYSKLTRNQRNYNRALELLKISGYDND